MPDRSGAARAFGRPFLLSAGRPPVHNKPKPHEKKAAQGLRGLSISSAVIPAGAGPCLFFVFGQRLFDRFGQIVVFGSGRADVVEQFCDLEIGGLLFFGGGFLDGLAAGL